MLHVQIPVNDWLQAVQRMPAKSLVKAFSVQWLSEAKAANPGVYTLHRYVNDEIQDVNPDDTEQVRENRARDWFGRFIDDTFLNGSTAGIPHWQATDTVSWWNEYYADSQDPAEKELWWKQERTAARIWRDEYRNGPHAAKLGHIKLAICATAVGNNIPVQSAETAVMYDCVLDYHPYDKYFDGGIRDPLSWQYHCGRWNTMDGQFRAAGYTCKWVFGESGPYGSAVTGWRHETIFGGDVARYVEAVRTWVREIKTTNAYQTGRVLGFALFTTASPNHWEWFSTRQPELNALAEMLAQEWTAVTPPPIDPPPPPDPSPLPPAAVAALWQLSDNYPNKINYSPNLGLWPAILAAGRSPVHTELSTTIDGKPYAAQAAFKSGQENELHVWTPGLPLLVLQRPVTPPLPDVDRPLGLDVSHHQGSMNWTKAKTAGAYFAFIKSSQRTNYTDPQFLINWQGAKAAGLLVAPYHYFQPGYDPIQQAEYFVNTVQAAALSSDLPYALDVEEGGSTAGFSDMVKACLGRIQQLTGRKPILYAGLYYLNIYLTTVTAAHADLWLANWVTKPDPYMPKLWSKWHFWQYAVAPRGLEFGAQSTNIDLNRWNGTLASLHEYANL